MRSLNNKPSSSGTHRKLSSANACRPSQYPLNTHSFQSRTEYPIVCRAGADDASNVEFKADNADVTPALPVPVPLPPSSYMQYPPEATYQPQVDPRYYQAAPVAGSRPQEYYMAPPPGYYPYVPPAPKEEVAASPPWFIWVGVGMAGAVILGKVQEFMKNPKTPQQMMTEMMMKQAMNAMGAKGGASPFGAAGGMPPFGGAAGMPPFGAAGFPSSPPGGFRPPSAAAAAAPVDVTPTPAATSSSAAESKPGERFKANIEGRVAAAVAAEEVASTKPPLDVVEPVVKEPTSGASSSGNGNSPPKVGFFTDVSLEEKAAKVAAESANIFEQQQQQKGATDSAATDNMMNMMETMLRNPEMQKMLYPYLPEPMRNPSSIEWMLSNPEVKKQMAQMFESQNMMSPQMMEMMKSMDFNQAKVNAQFDELGLKPEDVISKVMSDPDLASGFSNPKVQAAIMDISQNPMNIVKYQQDPEIMSVLEKVTQVFQPGVPPSAR
ncbi:hypothetical protein CEUSTIGMA_g1513.t1 [Chlamydomonas eustigma]|uniref:Protein TIC 40, chloroplastic n=2 Tax=Chlamydomonas eustigma TaxID=1157962 RepID=A0A250WTB2_9CHLO|nr:hypothetical protein CEUSTIGMA_g1513.t1 [Chlamydomonas eustigma]|eukprot:GAX74063.1 hypothetical protein CEUSTIGMA_g1513.t1 [Chlamydomonas eustigma]